MSNDEMREMIARWACMISEGQSAEVMMGMDDFLRETNPAGLEYFSEKSQLTDTLAIFGIHAPGEDDPPEEEGEKWIFRVDLTTSNMRLLSEALMPEATRRVNEGKAE
jgi:hypothetical protein